VRVLRVARPAVGGEGGERVVVEHVGVGVPLLAQAAVRHAAQAAAHGPERRVFKY
jgi:hypothetical protein